MVSNYVGCIKPLQLSKLMYATFERVEEEIMVSSVFTHGLCLIILEAMVILVALSIMKYLQFVRAHLNVSGCFEL